MRAISDFSLEAGMSTRASLAWAAFRMRVNKSEIGSVIISMVFPSLPTGLQHSGNFAFQGEATEADAAHLKFAQVAARASADAAAVAHANLVLQLLAHFRELRVSSHVSPQAVRSGTPIPRSNSRHSSSVRAVVAKVMFMPLILSTRV